MTPMKKHILAASLAIAALLVWGGPPAFTQGGIGYQQLTVSTTSTSITASVYEGATQCRGRLENAPIRVLWTGGIPTSTSGQPVAIGDDVVLGNRNDIANFKAITSSPAGTSGTLNLTCSSGTTATFSQIVSTTNTISNLPVCNTLLRAAGQACR